MTYQRKREKHKEYMKEERNNKDLMIMVIAITMQVMVIILIGILVHSV